MKIKAIIVDKVPKKCQDCPFGNRLLKEDKTICKFDSSNTINKDICPLITENDYLNIEE